MSQVYTAAQVAEQVNGIVKGSPEREISGVNALKWASGTELSFLNNVKYRNVLDKSKASVVLVPANWKFEPAEHQTLILCEDPDKAFTKMCGFFAPDPIRYEPGIHPRAYVHESAVIDPSAHVGPTAVVEEGAVVGPNAVISAGAYVGHFCKIGDGTFVGPNASILKRCVIGKRCIIHAGASIGADGFGFNVTFRGLVKIPQNGIVQIDDDVEVGANSTIDRARFGKTWIKKGVKIDNLVHIAHNVVVGESSALIGQCGIAGSAEIGRGVVVAAQAGVNGHITLGDGTTIAGASAVQRSTPPGAKVFGTPAESEEDFLERHMLPRKVRKMMTRLEKLESHFETEKE